jgi:hypothetical protein
LLSKEINVFICIFDNDLFFDLIFFKEIGNLLLVDGTKIKSELLKDLRSFLGQNVNSKEECKFQLQSI